MSIIKKNYRYLVAIFVIGLAFQFALQAVMKPYAIDGYLYQDWSSEYFMQTVPIEDLRNAPLESLANIHIQPPGYDALRAFFVQFWPSLEIHEALKRVDLSIYFLWTIIYSLGGAVVFLWLTKMTDVKYAFVSALLFFLHPAWIFYTTFLDTTLLSAFLILGLFFLLWKVKQAESHLLSLIMVTLLLFFFRSLFQWQFILLIGLSLFLLKIPVRKLAIFLVVVSTVFGLYLYKQKEQFNLISTSSFTGINLIRSVSITNFEYPYDINLTKDTSGKLPDVLARTKKLNGEINYNNYQYLGFNKRLTNKFLKFVSKLPIHYLMSNYLENLKIYFKPTSKYTTPHVIVDRLPWRNAYDWIFSAPMLPILLIAAGLVSGIKIFKEKEFVSAVAMILPALYIFLLSVVFEKGENNRFKLFLEPVFYIFIFSQFYTLYTWVISRLFQTDNK